MFEREKIVEERATDGFVNGVVTTDVFPQNHPVAFQVEDRGRMNPASAIEISLSAAQTVGHREKLIDGNSNWL